MQGVVPSAFYQFTYFRVEGTEALRGKQFVQGNTTG